MMIALVLAVLLVGSEARFAFNPFGEVGNKFNPLAGRGGLVDVAKNMINTATTLVNQNSTKTGNILETMTTSVKREVGGVAQPVESLALMTVFSQCEILKKSLGVQYISKDSLRDDGLDKLNVQLITPSLHVTYYLNQAAELIPATIGFNPNLPLIIFAHGFLSVPDSIRFSTLLEAFNSKGEYNVLALDSSDYIFWFYLRATTYVRYTGERLGRTLATMVQYGLNPSSIHLIGHSLGSHISGFTGKEFTRLTGQRIGRISGLDPAGPCFFNAASDLKLNPGDADFDDVIHTDHGALGITEPAGHADFYPNGGTQQPGCVSQICSHELVWKLYAESIIKPQSFLAVQCDTWDQFRENKCDKERVLMGYGATPNLRGQFFLQTDSKYPYGLGEVGASHRNFEGVLKSLQPLGPGAHFG